MKNFYKFPCFIKVVIKFVTVVKVIKVVKVALFQ